MDTQYYLQLIDSYSNKIQEADSSESLRDILREIEDRIKLKCHLSPYGNQSPDSCKDFDAEEIYHLLQMRALILNKMFMGTKEEIQRMKSVNEDLRLKTERLCNRVEALFESYQNNGRDDDFDGDYDLEGTLAPNIIDDWNYDECCSNVHSFDNDNYYGSDFKVMMPLIENICKYHIHIMYNLETAMCCSMANDIDDGTAPVEFKPDDNSVVTNSQMEPLRLLYTDKIPGLDSEYPLRDERFGGIDFCYATHYACCHLPFSLPDFLRIREFESEVKLTISDFDGIESDVKE